MFLYMSEQENPRLVGTVVTLPQDLHEKLRQLAKDNKRSLNRHAEWVIERYLEAQEDDAA